MYDFIQPMLFRLNKSKIVTSEITNWENKVALMIGELAVRAYKETKKRKDTLYIIVFPEFTFQKEKISLISQAELFDIRTILSNYICNYPNLLLIAGTAIWQDSKNKKIYNSALIFYQGKSWIWDKLFIHDADYANITNMGRWIPAKMKNPLNNLVYKPDNKEFNIKYVKEKDNSIFYSYNTPGEKGMRVVKVGNSMREEHMYNKFLTEYVLPYTISEGLIGSSLGETIPLFALSENSLPVIALDICRDHVIQVAKTYCNMMRKDGVKSIALYIMIADEITFYSGYKPKSTAVSIICTKNQLACIEHREQLKNPSSAVFRDKILEKGEIYNSIPLQIG